jgi:hypothetical protein
MTMPVSTANWTQSADGTWHAPGVQQQVPAPPPLPVEARAYAALAAVEKLGELAAGLLGEAGL